MIITLKKYEYDSMVMAQIYVKGHGDLTLFEISETGMRNLSGFIYDPNIELDVDNRLKIIGIDIL